MIRHFVAASLFGAMVATSAQAASGFSSAGFTSPSQAGGTDQMFGNASQKVGVTGYGPGGEMAQTSSGSVNKPNPSTAMPANKTPVVPEPRPYAPMLAGLMAIGTMVRRRSAAAAR